MSTDSATGAKKTPEAPGGYGYGYGYNYYGGNLYDFYLMVTIMV